MTSRNSRTEIIRYVTAILLGIYLRFICSSPLRFELQRTLDFQKSTNCNSTDLGCQVYYGSSSSYDLTKKAKVAVKRDNPDWENVQSKDNVDWGKYMGDYMVIISTTTTNSNG